MSLVIFCFLFSSVDYVPVKGEIIWYLSLTAWLIKQINKQMLERMRRKGNPRALLVGMQTGVATVEKSMEFPQKTKSGTSFDPAIPMLGLYPKNPETPIQKNLCTPMFIAAQFTIAK